jgi:ferredoxin/flavodoxin---NADP+ reductase
VLTLHVAVIGSGPSGFYAAEALLRSGLPVAVDMFERLPVPYGLVRFGVAPDHQKLKQVAAIFDWIAATPGFRFVGGVTVGVDVSIDALRSCYHAVILATGAEVGRTMKIPGETLPSCHQVGDFVHWYNGHPDFRDFAFDLSGERAVVVGHGNVALDVARILVKTPDELRNTDIAPHALDAIAESRIREVQIVGRRGLSQTRFSTKELEEFLELTDCEPPIDPSDFPPDGLEGAARVRPEAPAAADVIAKFARRPAGKRRRSVFRFGLEPVAALGVARVEGMQFRRQNGGPAVASGASVGLACTLILVSIGRVASPIAGVPYDARRGVHENDAGRVTTRGVSVPGLYVCGWGKRRANGTIGANRACSAETVGAVIADLRGAKEPPRSDPGDLIERLTRNVATYVDYGGWRRIDAEEVRSGRQMGRPRRKLVSTDEMVAVARMATRE